MTKNSAFLLLPPARDGEIYSRARNIISSLNDLNIKYDYFYKSRNVGRALFYLNFFIAILKSFRYEWVFCFISRSSLWIVFLYKLFGKKIIIDHFATSVSAFNNEQKFRFLNKLEKNAFTASHFVLTHTETMKKLLSKYYDISPDKIIVIYGIVDTKLFKFENNKQLINKLFLNDSTVFIYHGLFHQWHGLKYFLQAFNKLSKRFNNLKLIIIGGTKNEAEGYVKEFRFINQKSVIYLGMLDNAKLPKYLSLGNFWVGRFRLDKIGKRIASFCMFEAMSVGLIPITCNSFENKKVIISGNNGILVKEKSPADIYDKLIYYLNHKELLKFMSKSARKTVVRNYNLKVMNLKLQPIFYEK